MASRSQLTSNAQGMLASTGGSSGDSPILEEALYTEEQRANTLAKQNEDLQALIQDRTERKKYAAKIFNLVYAFIAATLFITWLNGVEFFYIESPSFLQTMGFPKTFTFRFKLDNSVMGWLLTTSSANVIAVFVFVVKYLFPSKSASVVNES